MINQKRFPLISSLTLVLLLLLSIPKSSYGLKQTQHNLDSLEKSLIIDQAKKNTIGVTIGVRIQRIRDSLLSVMAYHGAAPEYDVMWNYHNDKFYHRVVIGYANGTLRSSITVSDPDNIPTEHYQTFMGGYLSYTFMHGVFKTYCLEFLVGGVWDTYAFFKIHTYGLYTSKNYTGDFFSTIGPVVSATYKSQKHHAVSARVMIPLAAYALARTSVATRPPEGLGDDISFLTVIKSGDVLTFNKFVEFCSEVEYRYNINRTMSLFATGKIRYFKYSKKPLVQSIINTFDIGAMVSF